MTNKKAIRVLENIEYYLKTHTNESCEEEHTAIALAIKALEERPQGEWIISEYVDTRRGFITKCPFCKTDTIGGGNFCPNCGANMRKGGAE